MFLNKSNHENLDYYNMEHWKTSTFGRNFIAFLHSGNIQTITAELFIKCHWLCVEIIAKKQVFKEISNLQGNLKHIASITVSCAILTMCHNFRKGTSNIWQAESDKWLRIHLGCWFFDQFKTFILSHLIDFTILRANSFKIWLLFFPELTPIAPVKHKT